MTYSKFMEMLQREAEEKQQLQADISELQKEQTALEEKMKAAADAGETDTYLALSAESDTVAKKIFVKRSFQKKRTSLVNEAGAKEAWKDYVSGYNKKLKSSIAAFEEEKKKLCAMYSAMVELQKAACEVRETLGEAVGVQEMTFEMDSIPFVKSALNDKEYTLRLKGLPSVVDPDICYYISNHVKTNGGKIAIVSSEDYALRSLEAEKVVAVVIGHKSK